MLSKNIEDITHRKKSKRKLLRAIVHHDQKRMDGLEVQWKKVRDFRKIAGLLWLAVVQDMRTGYRSSLREDKS